MTGIASTFSDSWHRIKNVRACLKSTTKVHKQRFRGNWWYVLEDPFNNRFFRLKPETYRFITSLSHDKTIDEAWQRFLDNHPEEAPGQQEVIQLLTQLHHNNLIHYDSVTDTLAVFERQQKLKRKELKSKLLSLMFIRVPLFDPDRLLQRIGPFLRPLFSIHGLLFWFIIVLLGLKTAAESIDVLFAESNGLLAPDNLFLLYISIALVKTLHEFGHAIVCRHYSGEVHTIGVIFILLIPLPYMDATSSWSFKRSWQRVFVGGQE